MENNQLNTVEATIARFTDIAEAEHLPFGTQQGWTSSQYYMTSYLREHADNGACLNSQEVALFAAGRLEWLLRETRPSLSGLFTKQDVIVLLNCFQGDLFSPDQLSKMQPTSAMTWALNSVRISPVVSARSSTLSAGLLRFNK